VTSRVHERPKRLAGKLRAIRQHLGVSQTELKDLIKFKGHYGRISDYELGKRQPTILTLLAYARAAKIPLEQIVDDDLERRT
jgi:transcriptional regulator with XRE-family HTH domain